MHADQNQNRITDPEVNKTLADLDLLMADLSQVRKYVRLHGRELFYRDHRNEQSADDVADKKARLVQDYPRLRGILKIAGDLHATDRSFAL